MPPPESTFLYELATIAASLVGFSALIMTVRQTLGHRFSKLEAWITRTFVQLGFMITAGALTPPLLALHGLREDLIWPICSTVLGALMLAFGVTYPGRRRAVSGQPVRAFVYLDLGLLCGSIALLVLNAAGWPFAPNAGFYATGLTTALFVSGLDYLHALGNLPRNR
jgi:TM2 domain-containing membrane protein YozV